jgi:hypothetical protein
MVKRQIDELESPEVETLPVNKLGVPRAFYEISDRTNSLVNRLMKSQGRGVSVSTERGRFVNITPVDFFSLPPDASDADLLEFTRSMLGVDDLDEKAIEKLSGCLNPAKDFFKNYLHVSFPKEIDKLEEIRGREGLLRLLRKTKALSAHDKGFSPMYCALVKAMYAEWLYQDAEFQNLVSEGGYFYEKVFQGSPEGYGRFHKLRPLDKKWDVVSITGDDYHLLANVSSRNKDHDRCLCKFLRKPEDDILSAITDGIGLRFEVGSREDGVRLLKMMMSELHETHGVEDAFEIEHTHYFCEDCPKERCGRGLEEIAEYLGIQYTFKDNENPHANEKFESLSFKTKAPVPQGGGDGAMVVKRPLEVQVVLKGNENEVKFSSHEIYEAVQKLSVVTRLFGSFSEEYLDLICLEASQRLSLEESRNKSKLTPEKIKKYIIENQISSTHLKRSGKKYYTADDQFERWESASMIPSAISRKPKD